LKISLDYGTAEPLALDVPNSLPAAIQHGPVAIMDTAAAVEAAVTAPVAGPPLAAHVVPGDRVVIGVAGHLPGGNSTRDALQAALTEQLVSGGVAEGDITLLTAPSLALLGEPQSDAPRAAVDNGLMFDPAQADQTAYLLADEAGEPLHLARLLVDADVVLSVGAFKYDASLSGRSPEGELWPSFARADRRQQLARAIIHHPRSALTSWRALSQQVSHQLGIMASLRLVPGQGDSMGGIAFGLPEAATAAARSLARPWRPLQSQSALTIAAISQPDCDFASLTRAVAAAAGTTHAAGTISIACNLATEPGIVFRRWRQGAELSPLIREAVAAGDPTLMREALQTKLFARALGDRRLVLLSQLDQELVEDLDIGHAGSADAVHRLIQQADSVTVLHEATQFCPRRS
jgi:hypothetical protein